MSTKTDSRRARQGIYQKRGRIAAKYRDRIGTKIRKNYVGIARLRHGERPGRHRQQGHQSGRVASWAGGDREAGWVVFHASSPLTSFTQAFQHHHYGVPPLKCQLFQTSVKLLRSDSE